LVNDLNKAYNATRALYTSMTMGSRRKNGVVIVVLLLIGISVLSIIVGSSIMITQEQRHVSFTQLTEELQSLNSSDKPNDFAFLINLGP
jgi:hypothetical protein